MFQFNSVLGRKNAENVKFGIIGGLGLHLEDEPFSLGPLSSMGGEIKLNFFSPFTEFGELLELLLRGCWVCQCSAISGTHMGV